MTGSADAAQGRPASITRTEPQCTHALELELERERRGWYFYDGAWFEGSPRYLFTVPGTDWSTRNDFNFGK